MSILVLGGAGYIGSHTVDELVKTGYDVAVVDNLVTGHRGAIHEKARFYAGDIRDRRFMDEVFQKEKVDGVIHFAASSLVGESVEKPLKYFDNNVFGTQVLLETMIKHAVKKIIFSSTAATYGESKIVPIIETAEQIPTNPYGESKLFMEKMMKWCDNAHNLKYVALRYFNVAGASLDGHIGEDHDPETHLVPIILQVAQGKRKTLAIFGDDYPTEDGTCVRDYVHVVDLAKAHILAYEYLNEGNESNAFNLGSSEGFSVKEMHGAAQKVTGKTIPVEISPRRAGDPSTLVADSQKVQIVLGWQPQYTDLDTMIGTAWQWHTTHPEGYAD